MLVSLKLRRPLQLLFERELLEGQEAIGMTVVGQFHDLNNPDRFVWLRGFSDMAICSPVESNQRISPKTLLKQSNVRSEKGIEHFFAFGN